jgi:ABC-type Fe3+ transport system permease subunit
MTRVSAHPQETLTAHVRYRRRWWQTRSAKGIAYATPTAIVVAVFFLVPLALVVWMSANRWPLLGSPTFNLPDNYSRIPDDQLFIDAVWFTLKYTAIVTVVLSAVAMALALMVQQPRRGVGFLRTVYFLPGAVGFAAPRCCSTASTPRMGRSTTCCGGWGSSTSPWPGWGPRTRRCSRPSRW